MRSNHRSRVQYGSQGPLSQAASGKATQGQDTHTSGSQAVSLYPCRLRVKMLTLKFLVPEGAQKFAKVRELSGRER